MPIRSLTNGKYMDRAKSNNIINEIAASPGIKRMTTSELGELSKKIQKLLTSQNAGIIETSAIGNVSTRLQNILKACDVKKITIGELEHLRTKIRKILASYDRKIIGIEKADIKSRTMLNPGGSRVASDNGIYMFNMEVYV
jgi:hypothetical protein